MAALAWEPIVKKCPTHLTLLWHTHIHTTCSTQTTHKLNCSDCGVVKFTPGQWCAVWNGIKLTTQRLWIPCALLLCVWGGCGAGQCGQASAKLVRDGHVGCWAGAVHGLCWLWHSFLIPVLPSWLFQVIHKKNVKAWHCHFLQRKTR